MRNMNLLPKKSFLEKNLVQLLAAIVSVGVLLLVAQYSITANWKNQMVNHEQEKRRLTEQVESIRVKKAPDEQMTEYLYVTSELEKLKLEHTEWLVDITYIIGLLPKGTILKNMGIDEKGLFNSEFHFTSVESLLLYLQKLQAEPGYESLLVKEISKAAPSISEAGDPLKKEVEYARLKLEIQLSVGGKGENK